MKIGEIWIRKNNHGSVIKLIITGFTISISGIAVVNFKALEGDSDFLNAFSVNYVKKHFELSEVDTVKEIIKKYEN